MKNRFGVFIFRTRHYISPVIKGICGLELFSDTSSPTSFIALPEQKEIFPIPRYFTWLIGKITGPIRNYTGNLLFPLKPFSLSFLSSPFNGFNIVTSNHWLAVQIKLSFRLIPKDVHFDLEKIRPNPKEIHGLDSQIDFPRPFSLDYNKRCRILSFASNKSPSAIVL